MKILKKPLSILLSLVMILSVFTIIPMTSASAANGDTVSAEVSKWVKGTNFTADGNSALYTFGDDVYSNIIFVRVAKDAEGSWENALNQSYDTVLTSGTDTFLLQGWSDPGNGVNKMYGTWYEYTNLYGAIFLDANDSQFDHTAVDWYIYTWETFNLTEHSAVSPTFSNGTYNNGNTEYYTAGDRYFKKTGDDPATFEQITQEETVVPYFEFKDHGEGTGIKLEKCNSDDADITVPETVPSNYPDESLRGQSFSIIAEEAFKNLTSLESVTIGNNVNHIAGNTVSGHGAFYGCTNLETVTIGSNLDYVGGGCFYQCQNLTKFSTTSERDGKFSGVDNVAYTNRDDITLTVECYHDSGIARFLFDSEYDGEYYIEFEYLDEDPVEHTYTASWDWSDFDDHHTVYADIKCAVCKRLFDQADAVVSQVVDTPATCSATGTGHYKATVTYDGETFESENKRKTCTIPVDSTNHDWDTAASAVDWIWTPDDEEDPGLSEITATATVHCKNCDETDTLNAVVEYSGSDFSDCTAPGSARYTASAQCGGVTLLDTKDYTLSAMGHSLEFHTATAPTATTSGNIEYWKCTVCHKYFIDSNGEQEIDENRLIVPASGEHLWVYKDSVWDENPPADPRNYNDVHCTVIFLCEHCGTTREVEAIIYPSFTYYAPTCVENGLVIYTARAENLIAQFEYILPITNEHIWDTIWSTDDPVDHGNYWTLDVTFKCRTCNESHTVTANAYPSYRTTIVNATCTSGGYKRSYFSGAYQGSNTNEYITWDVTDPLGHNMDYHAAVAATSTASGNVEYWQCDRCGKYFADDQGNTELTYPDEVIIPMLTHFPKHSLTLNGDIGVNFYLDLSAEELAQGVRVDFAWNGKSDSATFDSNSAPETKAGAEGLYKATCYVCAAEMNDEITVSVTVGDSTEPIATETYKVRDYADVIIENKDGKFSDALIALVKTMLNYGAAAQNQFSHNTYVLANDGIGYELVSLSEDEISGITGDVPDKSAINSLLTESGIEYYGYSLILKTKTTLRFYFKKNGADTSQLALVNSDSMNIGTVKDYNDAYCYIEIEGIPAYELSDCYTLKYGDISLGSFSALSYVKDVLLNDNGAQLITDTVTALYRYHEAAKYFFDHPEPGQEETDIRPGN